MQFKQSQKLNKNLSVWKIEVCELDMNQKRKLSIQNKSFNSIVFLSRKACQQDIYEMPFKQQQQQDFLWLKRLPVKMVK
jgi:hypothetical protein